LDTLINRAALLRAELDRFPSFNLFTLLSSGSDEAHLHSRYLAFLLKPQGAHAAGGKLLQLPLNAEVNRWRLSGQCHPFVNRVSGIFHRYGLGQHRSKIFDLRLRGYCSYPRDCTSRALR
jgi:hypothetical protein